MKAPRDPKEAELRKKLRGLESKYERTYENSRKYGMFQDAPRLRQIGEQVAAAQKALDDYLAKRP